MGFWSWRPQDIWRMLYLFLWYCWNLSSPYFMTSNPGISVFSALTRDQIISWRQKTKENFCTMEHNWFTSDGETLKRIDNAGENNSLEGRFIVFATKSCKSFDSGIWKSTQNHIQIWKDFKFLLVFSEVAIFRHIVATYEVKLFQEFNFLNSLWKKSLFLRHKYSHIMYFPMAYSNPLAGFLTIKRISSDPWLKHLYALQDVIIWVHLHMSEHFAVKESKRNAWEPSDFLPWHQK